MPHVTLRNLGLAGLISDRPAYDLDDNAFSVVSNVRFFNGTAQKSSVPVERYSINSGALWMEIFLRGQLPEYTYADAAAIYEIDAGTGLSADVSKVGGYSASYWQSMVWSSSPVYNNGVDDPQIKEDGDLVFKDLPNWPASLQCKVIRGFKNFMVALNITDSGVESPYFLRWSNEAEPGVVPDSWEPLPTNLSGGNPLSAEDGEIIDGLELGDVFVIYTRVSAYEMSFIGGSFVMGFRKFTDNGLVAINAVCAFDHYHFCVSNWSIYTHDGHSVKHIGDQRVRDFLFQSVTNTDSIKCEHLASTKECIIYFEADGSGSGLATKALIWCYRYDTWSFIDLPGVARVEFGPDSPVPLSWEDYAISGVTWDQMTQTWAQLIDTSLTAVTYLLSSATDTVDDFDTLFGGGLDFSLERTGLDFDQTLGVATNAIKYIDQILPQITGSGTVSIELGFSNTPNGTVTWNPAVSYNIETDYKIDVRNSGRYPAWRFSGNTGGNFELSGIDFNVVIDGER